MTTSIHRLTDDASTLINTKLAAIRGAKIFP